MTSLRWALPVLISGLVIAEKIHLEKINQLESRKLLTRIFNLMFDIPTFRRP